MAASHFADVSEAEINVMKENAFPRITKMWPMSICMSKSKKLLNLIYFVYQTLGFQPTIFVLLALWYMGFS